MKAKVILYIMTMVLICFSCNYVSKEKKQAAMDYHDKMFSYYTPVVLKINELFSTTSQLTRVAVNGSLDSISTAKVYADISNLVSMIDMYTDSLNKIDEFDSKILYKKVCLENFADCKKLLLNEYPRLICRISEGVTEVNSIEISEIILVIYKQMIEVQKKSQETQLAFAKKYKFKLQGTLVNIEQLEEKYEEYDKNLKNAKKAQNQDPVIE